MEVTAPGLSEPAQPIGILTREFAHPVAASNPKVTLFATAFFPQFIHPVLSKMPQFAIFLGTFAVIEISWYLVYAITGKRLSVYLQRASVLRAFNRLTGGVFIGFAALMATVRE